MKKIEFKFEYHKPKIEIKFQKNLTNIFILFYFQLHRQTLKSRVMGTIQKSKYVKIKT